MFHDITPKFLSKRDRQRFEQMMADHWLKSWNNIGIFYGGCMLIFISILLFVRNV